MKPASVLNQHHIIVPDWPAPDYVQSLVTTRQSFQTVQPMHKSALGYDYFNLALHVNDSPDAVLGHRQRLAEHLQVPPSDIRWLEQVHGTTVTSTEAIRVTQTLSTSANSIDAPTPQMADACTSTSKKQACAVMTADCLPVLFCSVADKELADNKAADDKTERKVAAAHAGWRGLANGILSKTLASFSRPDTVIAWLGPAISQDFFEVGQEVFDAFISTNPKNKSAFLISPNSCSSSPKWLASLTELAKIELHQQGIKAVYGGEYCTYQHDDLFYSYRRQGAQSGRMASLIMIK